MSFKLRKREILFICCFMMWCLEFPIQSWAAESNIVIQLELGNYDSFSEKIEVLCNSGSEVLRGELTPFNHYKSSFFLKPEELYKIQLKVIGDDLHLIELSPAQFTVQPEEAVQTYTITVQDSGGMESENNIHQEIEYVEELFANNLESEPEQYPVNTKERTGTLYVSGPDVAGMKAFTYTLQNESGEILTYELKKENGFKAIIQLPYGRYQEKIEDVLIEPEDGIIIPDSTSFYCKYYGNKYGQNIVIDQGRTEQKNMDNMQLWAKRKGGADYKILNLYQFSGDEIMSADGEYKITGHVETREETDSGLEKIDAFIETEEKSIDSEKLLETREKQIFVQSTTKVNYMKALLLIVIIAVTTIAAISKAIRWRRFNGK